MSERVICPLCTDRGWPSHVTVAGGFVTAMLTHSFYDSEGRHHYHDPNERGRTFYCAWGHIGHPDNRVSCGVVGCDEHIPESERKPIQWFEDDGWRPIPTRDMDGTLLSDGLPPGLSKIGPNASTPTSEAAP